VLRRNNIQNGYNLFFSREGTPSRHFSSVYQYFKVAGPILNQIAIYADLIFLSSGGAYCQEKGQSKLFRTGGVAYDAPWRSVRSLNTLLFSYLLFIA
jgi:hypothetical protein